MKQSVLLGQSILSVLSLWRSLTPVPAFGPLSFSGSEAPGPPGSISARRLPPDAFPGILVPPDPSISALANVFAPRSQGKKDIGEAEPVRSPGLMP